jgi:hypothetical protein
MSRVSEEKKDDPPWGRPRGRPRVYPREDLGVNPPPRWSRRTSPPRPDSWKATHPSVSCRVSLEDLHWLQETAAETRSGFSDLLRKGLGVLKGDLLSWRTGFQAGRQIGYQEGCRAGFGRFYVPCPGCGRPLLIDMVANPELLMPVMQSLRTLRHYPYCPP